MDNSLLLTYLDEDDDVISLDTEVEFKELLGWLKANGKKSIKLDLKATEPSELEFVKVIQDDSTSSVPASSTIEEGFEPVVADVSDSAATFTGGSGGDKPQEAQENPIPTLGKKEAVVDQASETQEPPKNESTTAAAEAGPSKDKGKSTSSSSSSSSAPPPKHPFEELFESLEPVFGQVKEHIENNSEFFDTLQGYFEKMQDQAREHFERQHNNGNGQEGYPGYGYYHPWMGPFGHGPFAGRGGGSRHGRPWSCYGKFQDRSNNTHESSDNTGEAKPFNWYSVVCDGCDKGIQGSRFKCKTCDDYDLCSGCIGQKDEIHQECLQPPAFFELKRRSDLSEFYIEKKLKTLGEMGFPNREANTDLLKRYHGDLNRVVEVLSR